ncbi:hypothetical protein H4R33_006575 [Dimargaris cristalligena]|uniref:DUF4460 domain-containing protein n=1 Tax=Dimargaris cristalligena TaxID=215637 RepID=A0A4P9ZMI3_9FUNG|nr:hypothetical protein H4R33_006575 [Dimargaris cristalligena]RKP34423.1 hypothetical protein BJ085DRAFT_36197 [Dimargaris cristalligena]|eukprot:RKP34423.1 hypothetical protein BJ085DRAFT_36197 [Dimargaris cristalligena]
MEVTSRTVRRQLNQFLLHCHPDFFQAHPQRKDLNQESLQTLHALLEPVLATDPPGYRAAPRKQSDPESEARSSKPASLSTSPSGARTPLECLAHHALAWGDTLATPSIRVSFFRRTLPRDDPPTGILSAGPTRSPPGPDKIEQVFGPTPSVLAQLAQSRSTDDDSRHSLLSHHPEPIPTKTLAGYYWYTVAEQFIRLCQNTGVDGSTELLATIVPLRQAWQERLQSPRGKHDPSGLGGPASLKSHQGRQVSAQSTSLYQMREQFQRGLRDAELPEWRPSPPPSQHHSHHQQLHPPTILDPRRVFFVQGIALADHPRLLRRLDRVIGRYQKELQFDRWWDIPIMVSTAFERQPPGFLCLSRRFSPSRKYKGPLYH